jgi:hypothetical protein
MNCGSELERDFDARSTPMDDRFLLSHFLTTEREGYFAKREGYFFGRLGVY